MMTLNVQLMSFFVSFLYGIFIFILLEVNYKILTYSSRIIKFLLSMLFFLFNTLFYFIILLYINHGYIHFYFFICIFLGYFLCKVVFKWFVNRIIICYTRFKNSR